MAKEKEKMAKAAADKEAEGARATLKAQAEAETKTQNRASAALEEEARKLGVKGSNVKMSGYNIKDKTPEKTAKEEKRHRELAEVRLRNRVARAKAAAKMKPIDKRKALIVGRFKAVRSQVRQNTYTNANIEAWTEEYNLIINNPRQWNKITKYGTLPYTPGNKKKKSAKELLDSMNLDDETEENESPNG